MSPQINRKMQVDTKIIKRDKQTDEPKSDVIGSR